MRLPQGIRDLVFPPGNPSVAFYDGAAICVYAVLVAITVAVGHYYHHIGLSLTVWPAGIVAGCCAGFLLSPLQGEKAKFTAFARGVSTFLSGYLLSKFDMLFLDFRYTPGLVAHVTLFASFFLLTALTIFVARAYGDV